MNKIILMGRLTREPEIKLTATDKTICNFTLAVNRPFRKNETDFINVVCWNKTAEIAGNYLQKGHRCIVDGYLQIRKYEGNDGITRHVPEVIASGVEFVETKGSEQTSRNVERVTLPPKQNDFAENNSSNDIFKNSENFNEEIPF